MYVAKNYLKFRIKIEHGPERDKRRDEKKY